MSVTAGPIDGVPTARVEGPLDERTAGELRAALQGAVPNHAMGLVLDLRATTHVDSAGIHILFDIVKRLERRQQQLRLVIEPESLVADIVAATNLGAYAAVDRDVHHAVGELLGAPS
jgi:anti-anti-sigma factor